MQRGQTLMRRFLYTGSAAPLALLFTLVSMSFTVAYLKNSFNQSVIEKYRYAEWKALYAAEAGLNDVAMVVLPFTVSDTLLLPLGVMYGKDENNDPIGMYKDIACSTKLIPNSTRKEYKAYSTGVAEYLTSSGTNVSIERRVYTSMIPEGFEDYMYFTHEEAPTGPGNTGIVNFGPNDDLDGKIHTNGQIHFSNWGCPEFSGSVSVTEEAMVENGGSGTFGNNYQNCANTSLEEDGVSIVDTISQIIFPPDNSAESARLNATRTFQADQKLFRPGKRDTLIMTEINFEDGGYWAAQWWYNIPPVGNPPAEFSYFYDESGQGLTLDTANALHVGPNNEFDETTNTYTGNTTFIVLSPITSDGVNLSNLIATGELVANEGDQFFIYNDSNTKVMSFVANEAGFLSYESFITLGIEFGTFTYTGPEGVGFVHGENVTIVNADASEGLDEDFEWNNQIYYHDHDATQLDPADWTGYCEPGHRQHFDFDYWTAGGTSCDIFSCEDEIYNSEYVFMSRQFFPSGSSPEVIYVKGGQVLVRGTVSGQYTIVTDDYTEYRVHANSNTVDRVWGNIWLIDDVLYADSYASGMVIQPQYGGTDNVLGLLAGGNVIIANTRPNGARGGSYSSHIRINASILAMNGGFLSHYWQNTTVGYHDPTFGGIYNLPIADGRGGHRNHYRHEDQSGQYNGNNAGDYRGYVYLWGSMVQYQRGYMKRNTGGGSPYFTGDIGYDKNYNYDYNLRLRPPPYFPSIETTSGAVQLKMYSYGEANTDNQD